MTTETATATESATGRVTIKRPKARAIPLERIDLVVDNHREAMDPAKLEELTASMMTVGLLNAIGVCELDGEQKEERFSLIWGHRRLKAAETLNWKKIKAEVYVGLTQLQIAEMQAIENLQREDLTPIEEAQALYALGEAGQDVERVASRVDRSVSWVRGRLDLLRLDPEVRPYVASGRIPVAHARLIARMGDGVDQRAFANSCMGGGPNLPDAAVGDYVTTLADLRKELGWKMRTLGSKGWPMGEKYAGKRACLGCPDNTMTEPGLFDAVDCPGKSKKGNCTNGPCYGAKAAAWDKEAGKRRAQKDKKEAAEEKARQKRKKADQEGVCWHCGKERGQKQKTWKDAKECAWCTARIAKDQARAKKAEAKAKASGGRSGATSAAEAREIAAKRKAFPGTPAEKYAVALVKYGQRLIEALVLFVRDDGKQHWDDSAESLLRIALCPGVYYDVPSADKSLAGIAGVLAGSAEVRLDRIWQAKLLKTGMAKAIRNGSPEWPYYATSPRNVPLDAGIVGVINCLEALAGRWKIFDGRRPEKIPQRPTKDQFKDAPSKDGARKSKDAKRGERAKAANSAKGGKGSP